MIDGAGGYGDPRRTLCPINDGRTRARAHTTGTKNNRPKKRKTAKKSLATVHGAVYTLMESSKTQKKRNHYNVIENR